jgi:hypothetical protein
MPNFSSESTEKRKFDQCYPKIIFEKHRSYEVLKKNQLLFQRASQKFFFAKNIANRSRGLDFQKGSFLSKQKRAFIL